MKKSASILPKLRTRNILTVPFAILLLAVQTFHGELLQAREILNTDWSLQTIEALPDPGPQQHAGILDANGPRLAPATTPASHSEASLEQQEETWENARREQFNFRPDGTSFRAGNPAQHLDFIHSPSGLTITPRPTSSNPLQPTPPPAWSVTYQSTRLLLDATPHPLHDTNPACYENQSSAHRLPGCQEWFVNRASGLEHGFTIQKPEGNNPDSIAVEIELTTNLTPSYNPIADAVEFHNDKDELVLSYKELKVFDRSGKDLPAMMTLAHRGGKPTITLQADVTDAVYPITIDPTTVTQLGSSRMPTDVGMGDGFGSSSAGKHNHSAIGAPLQGNGAVYVYHRDEGGTDNWGQVDKLTIPASESPGTTDQFGSSVTFAHDEETDTYYLIVGAQQHGGCGEIFIWYLAVTGWIFLQSLQPAGLTTGAFFGCSAAAYGTMIAIGALAQSGKGAVYLFTLALGLFSLFQTITASNSVAGDEFGFAVALFATILIIGAPGRAAEIGGHSRGGAAYAFLAPVLGALFSLSFSMFFNNTPAVNDNMGSSVAAGPGRIAIGIPGAAKVVVWLLIASSWSFLSPMFGPAGSNFGAAMTMNPFGDIAVGAPLAETVTGVFAGAIFLFLLNTVANTYAFTGEKIIPDPFHDPGMNFGASLFFIGTLLFAMASNYFFGQGAFYILTMAAAGITFANWLLLYFTAGQIGNPALQHLYGFFGDRDGDGIPNYVEHLLGTHPTVFDRDPLNGTIRNGIYQILLPVSLITIAAILTIQYSFNMSTWFALGTGLLTGILTTRVHTYGIQQNIILISMVLATALAINPNFFLRYHGEEE